jgi:uncharacterized protein (DUF1778 family)
LSVSKKQQACVNRYITNAYDRINLTVPKGEKERIKAHADERGESVNAFIYHAICALIEEESKKTEK